MNLSIQFKGIFIDNCTGRNKNDYTVLKFLVYLTEMGYYSKVTFVFLKVGHTKNPADCLFNLFKKKDLLFDRLKHSSSVQD